MLRFGSHDPTYPQHVESPFVNLPVEMRTLIYSYLVPKNMVPSWISKAKLRSLKMDSALPLLRTNRQVYHEILELWYSSTSYCVYLKENDLFFANKKFGSISSLPPGFRFIKCLSLIIRLEYQSLDHARKLDGWKSKVFQMRLNQVKEIGDFFSTSGPGSLRTLNITFLPLNRFFAELENAANRREAIREGLDFNLHPLRRICVSERVSVGRPRGRGLLGCFADHKTDVISVIEEYFKWLEREISGSRTCFSE